MRIFIAVISFWLLSLTTKSTKAQTTAPQLITIVEGIKEFELKNGLRVLLIPDNAETNIAVNIVYKVGSRHEGYGESGMAHLLEHMLFKQSGKFADIKKAIADKGASANGTTWYDRTNYYEILSASDENLRWAIDMEADRMINSKILPDELKKEFSVVRNEFEIGENSAEGVLNERVLSSMYLWHNYGKSTIGSKEDIERVKAENLKTFYKKYYQPDNAVLIIAGRFDEKKALGYVQQYFGNIPKPARKLQPTYTVEPPQDGERSVTLSRTGDIQYVAMAYHTPSLADKDYVANEALIETITNDPSGVLYKKLVEAKLATSLYGYAQVLHDPGFSYFQVNVPMEKSIDSVKQILLTTMDEVGTMKFTEEELTRAKNILLKYMEDVMSKTTDLAIQLTEHIGAGDWRLWFLSRDRIEKLTVANLELVAKKYYKPSNRTVGLFIPEAAPSRVAIAETPDIKTLLTGYKGNDVAPPKAYFENTIENFKKHTEYGTLANGGKYALLEKPTKGDKIDASILLRFGNEENLSNKYLPGSLLADMLTMGTTTRTKEQIYDELDRIKTSISFSGGTGWLSINLNTDKNNLTAALNLLDDMLKNPKFDVAEYDKLIAEVKSSYEKNKNEPDNLVSEKLNKSLSDYPKGHPYYASSTSELLEDLSKINLTDLKKYYKDFYSSNHSIAAFVGELDKKVITSFLEKSFGNWNNNTPFEPVAPKYFNVKSKTETINTPDKTNAVVVGTMNLNISRQHPEYPAVIMANELLGGGAFLNSRIPLRLRENEGMSYGAGSYINIEYKYDVGKWGTYAYFNPIYKNKLDSALHEEIDKAIDKGFTADELVKTKAAYAEQTRTSLGNNATTVSTLRSFLQYDRDLSDYTAFDKKINELSLKEVNAALKKYFDKSKLVMIYGGDFEKENLDKPKETKGF